MSISSGLPRWLEVLLREKFHGSCINHKLVGTKNEKNFYCLDCCISICSYCLDSHRSHQRLQIRRYCNQDIINVEDVAKFIDCEQIHQIIINTARVVFINPRPLAPGVKVYNSKCISCHKVLMKNSHRSYLFCSISCKINHLTRTQGELSKSSMIKYCSARTEIPSKKRSILSSFFFKRLLQSDTDEGESSKPASNAEIPRRKRSSRYEVSPVPESRPLMPRKQKNPQRLRAPDHPLSARNEIPKKKRSIFSRFFSKCKSLLKSDAYTADEIPQNKRTNQHISTSNYRQLPRKQKNPGRAPLT